MDESLCCPGLTLAFVHLLSLYSTLHISLLFHMVPATHAQEALPDHLGRTGDSITHKSTKFMLA